MHQLGVGVSPLSRAIVLALASCSQSAHHTECVELLKGIIDGLQARAATAHEYAAGLSPGATHDRIMGIMEGEINRRGRSLWTAGPLEVSPQEAESGKAREKRQE